MADPYLVHSVSEIKVRNIYDTHHQEIKTPKKFYRNMQSSDEYSFKSNLSPSKKNLPSSSILTEPK